MSLIRGRGAGGNAVVYVEKRRYVLIRLID